MVAGRRRTAEARIPGTHHPGPLRGGAENELQGPVLEHDPGGDFPLATSGDFEMAIDIDPTERSGTRHSNAFATGGSVPRFGKLCVESAYWRTSMRLRPSVDGAAAERGGACSAD